MATRQLHRDGGTAARLTSTSERSGYLRRDGTAGFHRRHGRPRWDALPSGVVLLVLCIVLNPVMLLAGAPVALVVAEGLGRRLGKTVIYRGAHFRT